MLNLHDRRKDMSFIRQRVRFTIKRLQLRSPRIDQPQCMAVKKDSGTTRQTPIIIILSLAVSLLFLSPNASAELANLCDSSLTWTSATRVWSGMKNKRESVSIQRYENGTRIDIHGPDQDKSLIILATGEYIYRGAQSGVNEFLSADVAAGAPVFYLKRLYPTPCEASRASDFSLKLNRGDPSNGSADNVTGKIDAKDLVLNYTLEIHSQSAAEPDQSVQGGWSAVPIVPIPLKTSINGWSLTRGVGGSVSIIKVENIKEFYESQRKAQ